MKNKLIVIVLSLLLVIPVFSFADKKKESTPNISAYQHANEKAKFKRGGEVFNSKENKKIRAKKITKKKAAKAKEVKKEKEESEDKGEGQVKMKF